MTDEEAAAHEAIKTLQKQTLLIQQHFKLTNKPLQIKVVRKKLKELGTSDFFRRIVDNVLGVKSDGCQSLNPLIARLYSAVKQAQSKTNQLDAASDDVLIANREMEVETAAELAGMHRIEWSLCL